MSETHDTAVPAAAPIRLFPSDTLEFFTHVHPAIVPAVWGCQGLAAREGLNLAKRRPRPKSRAA